jgi:RHS repeat-associated protein
MQGAGGVGGLLFVSSASGGTHFPAFDGNGNVMGLVSAQDSSLSAQYEYGPFGEMIRATGPMATANPFRFSTKYQDGETGLLYYGYRYYDSSAGRWNSRVPFDGFRDNNAYSLPQNLPLASSSAATGTSYGVSSYTLEYECKLTRDSGAFLVVTTVGVIPWSYTERDCGYTCYITSMTGTPPAGYYVGMALFSFQIVHKNPWSGMGIGKCRVPDPKCMKSYAGSVSSNPLAHIFMGPPDPDTTIPF